MEIAFIVDYPTTLDSTFEWSGAEVSVNLLASELVKKGVSINVVAPSKKFYNKTRRLLTPSFADSPVWFFYSAFIIWKSLKNSPAKIIHVHGKNVLVGSFLANLFLNKRLIITVRDYRLLCNLSICLLNKNSVCNLREYFLTDIPLFLKKYKNSVSVIDYVYAYLTGIYEFFLRQLYKYILTKAEKVICISRGQELIYNQSGIKNTKVIYNLVQPTKLSLKKRDQAFFGGRYTLGKGKEILDKIIPWFIKKYTKWNFVVAGLGNVAFTHPRFKVFGQVRPHEYLRLAGESRFALVPSIFPEPFGRAALDALSVNTPALVSSRGGLPEIVIHKKYGLVVSPTVDSFKTAIDEAVKSSRAWSKNIEADKSLLTDKFHTKSIKEHIAFYEMLLSGNTPD